MYRLPRGLVYFQSLSAKTSGPLLLSVGQLNTLQAAELVGSQHQSIFKSKFSLVLLTRSVENGAVRSSSVCSLHLCQVPVSVSAKNVMLQHLQLPNVDSGRGH